jgi:hypothetical protein
LFLVAVTTLAEGLQILSRANNGRHLRGQGPCRENGSILMFHDARRETYVALNRSAVFEDTHIAEAMSSILLSTDEIAGVQYSPPR